MQLLGFASAKAALKPFVPRPLRKIPHIVEAKKRQLLNRVEVPNDPHFDEQGPAYFGERILRMRYLPGVRQRREHSSGRETENSIHVRRKRSAFSLGRRSQGQGSDQLRRGSIHCCQHWYGHGLGLSAFSPTLTPRRIAKWKSYPLAPWPMRSLPDLVLIDGRFRVACALVAIKNLYDKIDFEILFDDCS